MRRPLLTLLLFFVALGCPGTALARRGARGEKAGPVMLNFKIGPTIPIYIQDYQGNPRDVVPVQAAIQLEVGVALDDARNAYLVLPFEVHVGSRSTSLPFGGATATFTKVIVPIGFQYDIPIVRGLYVYPRASLGYVAYIGNFSAGIGGIGVSGQQTFHGGMFAPEFGIKYVWRHVQVGVEPFSLPVHFFAVDQLGGGQRLTTYLDYRIHFYVGAIF